MWNLNNLPEREESAAGRPEGFAGAGTGADEDKGKAAASGSPSDNSSSSAVLIDASDDDCPAGGRMRSVSAAAGRLFGVSVAGCGEDEEIVTRQFFPVPETAPPRPPPPATTTTAAVAGVQPLKKSRRGPRSRSSQYRGVTFYRRTGRWESHIW